MPYTLLYLGIQEIGEFMNKQKVKQTVDLLDEAFVWDETEEGVDYWQSVHNALYRIKEKGR